MWNWSLTERQWHISKCGRDRPLALVKARLTRAEIGDYFHDRVMIWCMNASQSPRGVFNLLVLCIKQSRTGRYSIDKRATEKSSSHVQQIVNFSIKLTNNCLLPVTVTHFLHNRHRSKRHNWFLLLEGFYCETVKCWVCRLSNNCDKRKKKRLFSGKSQLKLLYVSL